MATSIYASTPETTNANRACRAVLGPCTDGLRDILRHHVPPPTFPNVIKQKKLSLPRRLLADQRDLILPQHGSYTGNYGDMDISLLYILLRNISGIPPHSKGWGNDPDPSDTSLSANIERIRLLRNKCVHCSVPNMSNSDFNSIWSIIKSAMIDLDTFLVNGHRFENEVDLLRHEPMDPERDLYFEEELRKQVEEDTTTRDILVNLENKMENWTKSPIPDNVREQYNIDVQKWREEDKLYYETHSFPSMMEKVRNQPYVTFVGAHGSGNSATAHHIALKLLEEGYEIVPVDDIREIKQYCDTKNPQVFVVDDVVGVFGLQKSILDVLIKYKHKIINPCMVKSRTLMTCRETVFNETLPCKPFLTKEETVVKLHSSDNELDDNDKKEILKKYGLNVDLMLSTLLTSASRMFPLLCKLFSKETKFQVLGSNFFMNPIQCIIDELDDMQRHNKLNYATLVLCMLNENSLSKIILKDKQFIDMKMNVLENCRLKHNTDTFKFIDALSAMEGTYTKQCGKQYTFIHGSMFEICACHYGKQFPDQMLLYMSSSYIANYVKPQTSVPGIVSKLKEKHSESQSSKGSENSNDSNGKKENDDKNNEKENSFDLCIRLCEDQYPLLAERLYRDIQNMELYDVFRNQVLKHPKVCRAFIDLLETKSYSELKSLFLSSRGDIEKIVSKRESVEEESEERDEWGESVRQETLVDQRYKRDDKGTILSNEYTNNVRVISWVIYHGHYQIIEYIVQQTEQHNEISELFEITGNYPHRSESWIYTFDEQESENNRLVEESRLLVLSCYSGDVQTVRVLLHVCKNTINGIGQSEANEGIHVSLCLPLTIACYGGYVTIVEELLKAGADVNLQDNSHWGNTPLIAACKEGHASVVKELVKAGVDVNLQDELGDPPLVIACKKRHLGVIKELVKAGVDVNLQNELGYTPLILACDKGHASVVEELIKAGANVNLQDNNGDTPLIVACKSRNGSVIEELMKGVVDFNLQDKNGNTPLIVACKRGHLNIVEVLVKAGTDINLQDRWGNAPLIAAVIKGSLPTVKYLLEHGADWVTAIVDVKVSAVYRALILNKPDIVKYLIQEQNKINPGTFTGNVHLFNCLMDIRHAGVTTDSRDDVVVTDRSVWGIYRWGTLWRTICKNHCDALTHLLCVGMDVNQLIQFYRSDVTPLLFALIDQKSYVNHRMGRVSILLGAGADVNDRVRYREYKSVLDREGVSVLERTRRLMYKYRDSNRRDDRRFRASIYKKVMCEIKKHVRRHSV